MYKGETEPLLRPSLGLGLTLLHPCSLGSVPSTYKLLFLTVLPSVGGVFGVRMTFMEEILFLVSNERIHLLSTVRLIPGDPHI